MKQECYKGQGIFQLCQTFDRIAIAHTFFSQ